MKRNKKHNFSKYSDSYYKWILTRSAIGIILLTSVLLLFSIFQSFRTNYSQLKDTLQTENDENYTVINETLENTKRIAMFLAQYKTLSPVFQLTSDLDIQNTMILQEAKTFIMCFDYLSYIEVDTGEEVISYGSKTDADYQSLPHREPFNMYVSDVDTFPPTILLEYNTSDHVSYSTKAALSSIYLSRNYMSEHTYLLAPDGTILLAKQDALIRKNISEITNLTMDELRSKDSAQGYILTKQELSKDGMLMVSLMEKSSVFGTIVSQILAMTLIYLVITAIGIIILFLYLNKLYFPIKDVAQILKYYVPDDNALLENDAQFIKMCAKEEHITEDVDAALFQIKKSQLHTLHSQISPHLLGNTLESIKWEIIKEYGFHTKIEHALSTLSGFLYESYQYHQMITSIRSEIERTKQYSDMMVACICKGLEVDYDVAEDVMDCAIISLTLQPFIENSINHGFVDTQTNPRILVTACAVQDEIHICIADNGGGMNDDTLESLKNSLKDDQISGRHVGIKNSHLKLKLLFGKMYGVTNIQSDAQGTRIEITIPKYKVPLYTTEKPAYHEPHFQLEVMRQED